MRKPIVDNVPPPVAARTEDLPARLKCQDGQLVKPNGKPIRLRGVSFGSWGNDDPIDVQQIADLGANCVRVALRWHGPYGDPSVDARDDNGFAFLSRGHVQRWLDIITAASAAGLWVVPFIDSDCGQNGMQDPETVRYCDPYGTWGARGRNFYTDLSLRRVFAQIVWPAAAARLRMIARIAMLEIHPEPAGERGPDYIPLVSAVQRECIDAIRAVDADTPFLLGPREGYKINLADEAWLAERTDCVYTGNLLNQYVVAPDKFDEGLACLTRLRDERGAPVFVQQMGRRSWEDPDLEHMRRALERMDAEDVGYAWWQWKQKSESPDDYGLNYKGPGGVGWVQKDDELALLSSSWRA